MLPTTWHHWCSRPDLSTLDVEGVSSAELHQAREALAAGEQLLDEPGSLVAAGTTIDRALAQAAAAVLALRQVHLPCWIQATSMPDQCWWTAISITAFEAAREVSAALRLAALLKC